MMGEVPLYMQRPADLVPSGRLSPAWGPMVVLERSALFLLGEVPL